jgi:hypothetical protein
VAYAATHPEEATALRSYARVSHTTWQIHLRFLQDVQITVFELSQTQVQKQVPISQSKRRGPLILASLVRPRSLKNTMS